MRPSATTLPSDPVRYRDDDYYTLRQLDEHLGCAKGTTFRRFRRAALQEGRDFHQLCPGRDEALIGQLIEAGRAYPAPPRVLLIRAEACRNLLQSG
ncbi:hypothetical protein DFR31_1350 [Alkalispirillum mobile]|uniref:Uncharacterized protein n=1 Tax=Alkalispirillum mobile TaxID=85925 RepID=A0A498C5A8_9GAMM|nr:hypothetical protein [Alkalispirillum mobile]RLK51414.1 hypothetical protein DFR31_1350 [Alkalispirillum mobile]